MKPTVKPYQFCGIVFFFLVQGDGLCSNKGIFIIFSFKSWFLLECNSLFFSGRSVLQTPKQCHIMTKHLPFTGKYRGRCQPMSEFEALCRAVSPLTLLSGRGLMLQVDLTLGDMFQLLRAPGPLP